MGFKFQAVMIPAETPVDAVKRMAQEYVRRMTAKAMRRIKKREPEKVDTAKKRAAIRRHLRQDWLQLALSEPSPDHGKQRFRLLYIFTPTANEMSMIQFGQIDHACLARVVNITCPMWNAGFHSVSDGGWATEWRGGKPVREWESEEGEGKALLNEFFEPWGLTFDLFRKWCESMWDRDPHGVYADPHIYKMPDDATPEVEARVREENKRALQKQADVKARPSYQYWLLVGDGEQHRYLHPVTYEAIKERNKAHKEKIKAARTEKWGPPLDDFCVYEEQVEALGGYEAAKVKLATNYLHYARHGRTSGPAWNLGMMLWFPKEKKDRGWSAIAPRAPEGVVEDVPLKIRDDIEVPDSLAHRYKPGQAIGVLDKLRWAVQATGKGFLWYTDPKAQVVVFEQAVVRQPTGERSAIIHTVPASWLMPIPIENSP